MPISSLWDRIADAGPAAVVLIVASVALLALPVLRRLVPRNRRHRGGPARLFLGLSLLLAASAIAMGTMGAASPGNLLQLAGLLALVLGLIALGGLVVFDVALPRLRFDVPSIVRDLVLVVIGVATAMGFLRLAGLDVFSLVTTSAVLTAVIGLALQSTIANVFGGLSLQLDRTLRHGEWIQVGDRIGKILEIGWRSTRILTKDGDTVFVPNSELISKEVLNFARPTGAHRMTVQIGFHYRHPPNEVRRVLLAAIRGIPEVVDQPAPDCGPIEFGNSAVVYALRYWIADFARDTSTDEEVHARVWYAARRAGLEIPYPTHTFVSEHGAARARAADQAHEHEQALDRLESTEPFARLEAESRRRSARTIRRLEFGQGEQILRSDEPDDGLYVIDSGDVSVRVRSNGTSRPVAMLHAGDLLGRTLLPADVECAAHSDVVLYRLDDRALQELLASDPQLDADLSAMAAARRAAFAGTASSADVEAAETTVRFAPRIRRLFGQR